MLYSILENWTIVLFNASSLALERSYYGSSMERCDHYY